MSQYALLLRHVVFTTLRVLFGILAIVMVILAAMSYRRADLLLWRRIRIVGGIREELGLVDLVSATGRLGITMQINLPPEGSNFRAFSWNTMPVSLSRIKDELLHEPLFSHFRVESALDIQKVVMEPSKPPKYRTHRIYSAMLPYWFLALVFGAWPLLWLRGVRWRRRRIARGECIFCGYDLRASAERCPECGKTRNSGIAGARS